MKGTKRNPFPYDLVARLWADGKTIAEIAEQIGRIDKKREDGDKHHTLRVFLMRMHAGYRNKFGKIVKLPYRASRKLVSAAKQRSQSAKQNPTILV
jgi:hypothetical protein